MEDVETTILFDQCDTNGNRLYLTASERGGLVIHFEREGRLIVSRDIMFLNSSYTEQLAIEGLVRVLGEFE